jgi:hypothetical protein
VVGDGKETFFWTDPLLDDRGLEEWVLDLTTAVDTRHHNRRTVAETLVNKTWIKDITDTLTIPAIIQYLHLRARIDIV